MPSKALKAVQGLFEALACPPAPEVPALLDQVVRVRNLEAVSQLGPVGDPGKKLAQGLLDLADGDGHRVLGHQIAVPGLIDHLRIADIPAAVVEQRLEGLKGLGAKLEPISQQRLGCRVEPKWPERNLFHKAPSRYRPV